MKSELSGAPTTRTNGVGGGEEVCICKIYRDVPLKWVDFTPKIFKHGSHFDPPQKIPKHGSNCRKLGKNHGENLENWYIV